MVCSIISRKQPNGSLKRIATTKTVEDDESITWGNRIDLFTAWGQLTPEIVQKIATETWAAKDWTQTANNDKLIVPLSHARGEMAGGDP